jgi:uncharacterized protein YggE
METSLGNRVTRRALPKLGLGALLLAALVMNLFGAGRAGAQEATPVAGSSGPTVTVGGQGTATISPDLATVTIGVQISNADLAEAQSEASTQMNAVIEAIKGNGVEDADIQTSYYNVNVLSNYDNNGNPIEVTGYQISHQVTVTVRDLDSLNTILESSVDAGANTIYGISFGIADPSAAETEARKAAVEDAKAKAQELADAAGLQLGSIVSIVEGVQDSTVYPAGQFAGGKGGAGVAVESGSLQVSVNVQITFELSA